MEASSCKLNDAAEEMKLTMYLKEGAEEHCSVDGAQNPASARHDLPPSSTVATPSCTTESSLEQIKVGSFYEVDHSKLSPTTPEQLKAIRIVMVSEKDESNISLRYPSVYSLRTHFRNCENPNGKKLPGLNEKYIMSSNVAGDVLYRRIPTTEIEDRKNSWNFWTSQSMDAESYQSSSAHGESNNGVSKKGVCWSELKFTGMVRWGSRRQVRYIGRHGDQKVAALSKSLELVEEKKESLVEEKKKANWEEGEKLVTVTDEDSYGKRNNLKRRRLCSENHQKKLKKATPDRKNRLQIRNISKKKELKKTIDRWSVDRYKLAEQNMLTIMKGKRAVFGNPILRPALRMEARKLIGDTGLLDHLLKHMAGKVAPGGAERFRRRHNSDGAMEYWLESADLINIRREAGVQDPYWTPPPGWKLGDNPSQDPICSREIKKLHDEIAQIKKYIQELASSKQQALAVVAQPNSDITNLTLDHKTDSLIALKESYNELLNRKAEIEEQFLEISQSLSGLEEHMRILKSKAAEDQNMSESEPPFPLLKSSSPQQETQSDTEAGEIKEEQQRQIKEEKAAKIERLKSGFRICKPQGTFLWPNMVISPHSMLLHDDPFAVPTPTSASSTTTALPRLDQNGPHPSSPVKPLAIRRTVSSTLRPILINLNEVPQIQHCDLALCETLTYQRRHLNSTSSPDLPHLASGNKDDEVVERKECSVSASSIF